MATATTISAIKDAVSLLGKRDSFAAGAQRLSELVVDHYGQGDDAVRTELMSALARIAVVLKTRYSSAPYWEKGFACFETANCIIVDTQGAPPKHRTDAAKYEDEARAQLHEIGVKVESKRLAQERRDENAHHPPEQGGGFTPQPGMPANVPPELLQLLTQLNIPGGMIPIQGVDGGVAGESAADIAAAIQMNPDMFDFEPSHQGPPPASRDARDELVLVSTRGGADDTCPICQEEFPPKAKAKKMPCGHYFHDECITSWLLKHNSCPNCRNSIASEKLYFDSDADRIKKGKPSSGLFT